MSIYKILDTAVPTISYCVLHQGASPSSGEEYLTTLRDLHAAVRRESDDMLATYTKHVHEVIGRESQVLRGTLSEFLSMPVRSDTTSVQRIFSESFERLQEQVVGNTALGVSRSYEGKFVIPSLQKAADRTLAANGTAYLKSLGFVAGKSKGEIHESVFVVEGGMNLDMLEHIVRDRLGIYAATHGKHLDLAGGYAFAAYNLVGSWGLVERDRELNGQTELVIVFAKPTVQYGPFRAELAELLGTVAKDLAFPLMTLWQRKLGLGKGKEFILRCLCDSPRRAGDLLRRIEQCKGPGFVKKALLDHGGLVVKQLLIP